jgi:hypothetical protein
MMFVHFIDRTESNWCRLCTEVRNETCLIIQKSCSLIGPYIFYSWTWTSKMGPICCPEMSVKDYYSTLRNNPEERWSQYRGGNLKSRIENFIGWMTRIRFSSGTFCSLLTAVPRPVLCLTQYCLCNIIHMCYIKIWTCSISNPFRFGLQKLVMCNLILPLKNWHLLLWWTYRGFVRQIVLSDCANVIFALSTVLVGALCKVKCWVGCPSFRHLF